MAWPRQVPSLPCPSFPFVHICLAPPRSTSSRGRAALHRDTHLHLLFVRTVPALPSPPARNSPLTPVRGTGCLCPPPLSTEVQVPWQSALGIPDNDCVSFHVIKLSTLERKRCGFVPITKTNKQGLIFITGQGYSASVFWNSSKLLKKVYS